MVEGCQGTVIVEPSQSVLSKVEIEQVVVKSNVARKVSIVLTNPSLQ